MMRRKAQKRIGVWRQIEMVLNRIRVAVIVLLVITLLAAVYHKLPAKAQSTGLNRPVMTRIDRTRDFRVTGHQIIEPSITF